MTNNEPDIDAGVIPTTLRDRDQWVCWRAEERDGKPTKIPVTSGTGVFASATDPETWASFAAARDYVEADKAAGVGFVFTDDDPIVGIDLDDCRDPETGDVDDTARDIIERLDSYTEISPSGTGYHVLIMGDLPDGRNRRGSVELYDSARFFTVTGDHVDVTPGRIAHRQDALVAIHREYVQDSESESSTQADQHNTVDDGGTGRATEVNLDDEELLRKARNASNGAKFDRLWNGNTAGYDSQSEADMALCCLLAFWTGGDVSQMDRLFRQSGLMREKWDEVHYADGSTYGEKTIERAIATTSEFYKPQSQAAFEAADTATDRVTASDNPERSRAYLIEKNQLLRERIATLEATLETKIERIDAVEAKLEQVEARQPTRTDLEVSASETACSSRTEDDTKSEGSSFWGRTKRMLGVNLE